MPIHDPVAARRLAVLHLVLRLTAGAFASTAFSIGHQPFGDAFETMKWLRQQLAPLARQERLIRDVLRVIDPEWSNRPWDSPRGAKHELLRLAAAVRARAPVKRMCRPTNNGRLLPSR